MRRRLGLGLTMAVFIVNTAVSADFKGARPTDGSLNSVMATYARIDWNDPLNPRYVNLGNDQLLIETMQGIRVWNVPNNEISPPHFSVALAGVKLVNLVYGTQNWARMGNAPAGTGFVGVGSSGTNSLLWWNGTTRDISTFLPIEGKPELLAINADYTLLCAEGTESKLVRLNQAKGVSRLEYVTPGMPEVQAALRAKGVVGPVAGYTTLTENDVSSPVFYDVARCGWEIVNPPERIRGFLDRKTRSHSPDIKPYFLRDGSVLLSEVSYYGERNHWEELNPPLLWRVGSNRWVAIEYATNGGSRIHRVGQDEPVFSHSFESKVIEFLNTKTMTWITSKQRLPLGYAANIEPLSTGNALVLMRESDPSYRGIVGIVEPQGATAMPGRLSKDRYGYDGEIALRGGLMLVGDDNVWNPSSRSEIIHASTKEAKTIASLPIPLVSPYGLELRDGSVLVFGGLPARCGPHFYSRPVEPCSRFPAQSSFRYIPQDDRWEALPNLTIPFEFGIWWQTGNSGLTTQWARNDARVRRSGELVWIEQENLPGYIESNELPQGSYLKVWQPDAKDAKPKTLGPLRKARKQSTLLELADGRLALVGGIAQLERVALEKECFDCPDEFVSLGPFREARTTEVFDEFSDKPSWQPGPVSHFSGGRAIKLANGRVFKLSLTGSFDSDGYRAEIADAAFSSWEKLPPFPLKATLVRNLGVVGNRAVIITDSDKSVAWDDDGRRWQVLSKWPKGAGSPDDSPISATAMDQGNLVLIRYRGTFEIVPIPTH